MNKLMRSLIEIGVPLALLGCSADQPRGIELAVAPLQLTNIDVACFDLAVAGQADTVWTHGDPALDAYQGDADAICSDRYGSGPGGDITYVGTCDASLDADTDPDRAGVQNAVTVWFDGLYTGSSSGGLAPLDAPIQGTCHMSDFFVGCMFPPFEGRDDLGLLTCESDADCVAQPKPTWQDPCGAAGCTLEFDCNENEDTLVEFNFTVMRDAEQGFFDVAVNFDDVFCSAKYDTCYDVGTAEETPIRLLHGQDGERAHTGVMGLACAGEPNSTDVTKLHRSEIWVWCNGWDTFFVVDPTLGPGNVEVEESFDLLADFETTQCEAACMELQSAGLANWSKGSSVQEVSDYCATLGVGDCSDWATRGYADNAACLADAGYQSELAYCSEFETIVACVEDCQPDAKTLRYATYWGDEDLDCGSGAGSCNKVFWNIAFNLEHLQDQGLDDCQMVSIATASKASSTAIVDGELAQAGTWYPVIDFGGMDGDWNTGLPLTGAGTIPCVAEQLDGEGSDVVTDYAATGAFDLDESAPLFDGGPIVSDYWTWLCFTKTQSEDPTPDPECIARYCRRSADMGGSLPSFCAD